MFLLLLDHYLVEKLNKGAETDDSFHPSNYRTYNLTNIVAKSTLFPLAIKFNKKCLWW